MLNLSTAGKILALSPGAEYGPAKRWPTAHFAQMATWVLEKGWQVWILGSQKDQAEGVDINRITGGRCIDLTGKTQLSQAIELLSLVDAVICNDSGLMHIAAALQRPLFAIFGSSNPGFTPPLSEQARILSLSLPCAPCMQRVCPLQHTRCLQDLRPSLVMKAFTEAGL
jgi:heptosyltransferase II